ncbi:MAG TPA: hypothetical protein VFG56_02710 [Candidatus Saccharimonadales bacterium]|nr:hypothetical protein [Candidatus Saccharimonadales bacterium]
MEVAPYFVRPSVGAFERGFSTEKTEEVIEELEDPSGTEQPIATVEQLDGDIDWFVESLDEVEVIETANEAEPSQDETELPRSLGTEALTWFEAELINEEEPRFERRTFSFSDEELIPTRPTEEVVSSQPALEGVAVNEAIAIDEESQYKLETKNGSLSPPKEIEATLAQEAIVTIEQIPKEEIRQHAEAKIPEEPKREASRPNHENRPNSLTSRHQSEKAVNNAETETPPGSATGVDHQTEAEVSPDDSRPDTQTAPKQVNPVAGQLETANRVPEVEAPTESPYATSVESVEEIITYVEHRIEQIVTQRTVSEIATKPERPTASPRRNTITPPRPIIVYQSAPTKMDGGRINSAPATAALPETGNDTEETDSVTKIVQEFMQKLDQSSITEQDAYLTLRRLRQRIAALQGLAEVLRQQLGRQAIRLSKVPELSFA